MEDFQKKFKNPVLTGVLGFIAGLFIGLVVLGWWLFPVEWKDAAARDLREDAKLDYLRMTIDSYILRKDPLQAKMRWNELQPDAERLFAVIQNEEDRSAAEKKAIAKFSEVVQALPSEEEGASTAEAQPPKKGQGIVSMFIVFIIIALCGVAAAAIYFLRNYQRSTQVRRFSREDAYEESDAYPPSSQSFSSYEESSISRRKRESSQDFISTDAPSAVKPAPKKEEIPIAQFLTTYTLGDDLYDDSFSIDSPSGEFLGECGVGISQTIGVGEPKKVTALELWLFDKNDIQTVTKVLMTQHAFNDPDIKHSLLAKGEPLLAQIGNEIALETATLILMARVVDMAYGSGPLPPKSYFERITLDLQLFRKK